MFIPSFDGWLQCKQNVHQECSTKFKEENYHSLADIGSHFLYIVHGAFRTGAERSEQGVRKLLKDICLYTPARRDN